MPGCPILERRPAAFYHRTMRLVVLSTSYPRSPEDVVGRFIAGAVERLRAHGVLVEVVSPRDFRHFGIAYGYGVLGNLRRRPWLGLLLPAMLASFVRAARRAAHDADLVHAHWLPAGAVATTTGRPFVVQLWGTDVELARRARWIARWILRRARLTICASRELADAALDLGAETVRVIPSGVDIPDEVGEPDDPPHVLYAGRLSEEKGVLELVEAARGLPLVVAGDGPLRRRIPGALGFVPHDELLQLYERAAVVVCPSRREGFGVVCAEAMAHGRPVVATAVGGLRDLVVDGETGVLVPPGDSAALRAALERLLGDPELRRRLGAAARARARSELSWERFLCATLEVYRDALGGG
jgi:glycosyltransferase involved in cell wall biosynthesis